MVRRQKQAGANEIRWKLVWEVSASDLILDSCPCKLIVFKSMLLIHPLQFNTPIARAIRHLECCQHRRAAIGQLRNRAVHPGANIACNLLLCLGLTAMDLFFFWLMLWRTLLIPTTCMTMGPTIPKIPRITTIVWEYSAPGVSLRL